MAAVISHALGKRGEDSVERGVDLNPWFLLSNNKGGFACFSSPQESRFQGVYFSRNFIPYKVIEDIIPMGAGQPIRILNHLSHVERIRKKILEELPENPQKQGTKSKNSKNNGEDELSEIFFMPKHHDALYYELDEEREILFRLDCKKMNDNREFGRYYKVSFDDEFDGRQIIKRIVVEYTKKTDKKEDKAGGRNEYKIYLVVSGDIKAQKKVEDFVKTYYSFDKRRNSPPSERFVYDAFTIAAKKIFISYSDDLNEALRENTNLRQNIEKMVEERKERVKKTGIRHFKDKEANAAYVNALHSLYGLTAEIDEKPGIFAGFPWFLQYWTRDEAVSLGALILENKFDYAKDILFRQIMEINDNGMSPQKYPADENGLESADGAGWVFRRVHDLIETLRKRKILLQYFRREELYFIKNKLEETINILLKHHTAHHLATNKRLETWMDTGADGADGRIDTRAGSRIEIQALRLNMYRLLGILSDVLNDETGYNLAKELEHDMKKAVVHEFYKRKYLRDSPDDDTIRPNIFIAYYIYPDLLSKEQWEQCFKIIVPKLFNIWGGFSTIDKSSKYYRKIHTGEDSKSYHHGDSWFWINNLAAVCLARVSWLTFRKEIERIFTASTGEILWGGIIGSHAEISPSEDMESMGCLDQAWSSAMYIELVHEIF